MKYKNTLIRLAATSLSVAVPNIAAAHEVDGPEASMQLVQMGTYVVASDLAASKTYYAKLLDRQPVFETPVFVAFIIEGGLLAIASREEFAPDASVGGNVVPYLRVEDIDEAFAYVSANLLGSMVSEEIIREGPIALFKTRDPDGNMVEFYSLSSAPISSAAD